MNFDVIKSGLLTLMFIALPSALIFAQEETEIKEEKKVIVITKTIDADGNVTVEKVVKEGGDISDEEIQQMIEEGDEKEVKVTVRTDKKTKDVKAIKEKGKSKTKSYTIEVDGEDVKINQKGDNVFIFKADGDDEDVRVFKVKGDDGEDIEVEVEEIIEKEEHEGLHEEHIKKIKKGNGAFLGLMADPEKEGALEVLDVVEGSAAEKCGLQKGDVLNSINGKAIDNFESLIDVLAELKPNDQIEIGYTREGVTQSAKATLTEHKADEVHKIIKIEKDGDHEGDVMKWIQKDGEEIEIEGGEVIIIEEEIEETEKGGKKIVKKKKIIKKKAE